MEIVSLIAIPGDGRNFKVDFQLTIEYNVFKTGEARESTRKVVCLLASLFSLDALNWILSCPALLYLCADRKEDYVRCSDFIVVTLLPVNAFTPLTFLVLCKIPVSKTDAELAYFFHDWMPALHTFHSFTPTGSAIVQNRSLLSETHTKKFNLSLLRWIWNKRRYLYWWNYINISCTFNIASLFKHI